MGKNKPAIIRVKKENLQRHSVGCQSKARIVNFTEHNYKPAYVVEFTNKKHRYLNDRGPFLTEDCIIWTPVLEVLYGTTKV